MRILECVISLPLTAACGETGFPCQRLLNETLGVLKTGLPTLKKSISRSAREPNPCLAPVSHLRTLSKNRKRPKSLIHLVQTSDSPQPSPPTVVRDRSDGLRTKKMGRHRIPPATPHVFCELPSRTPLYRNLAMLPLPSNPTIDWTPPARATSCPQNGCPGNTSVHLLGLRPCPPRF